MGSLSRAELESFYDEYPRIEDDFRAALDASLGPRGPGFLYDLVAELGLSQGGSVDLVWCRDVLVHVEALDRAYAEFRRILRNDGRVLVYQWFGTERLEPREAEWLWNAMRVVPANADPERTEAAAGCFTLPGCSARRGGYVSRFGQAAYDIMLGDCL